MQKLNKSDLVEAVSEKSHISKKDAENAIDATFDLIEKALLRGEEVNITNFGTFTPKNRQQRDGTDPKTHMRIVIKQARIVSFKLSKAFKAKLN